MMFLTDNEVRQLTGCKRPGWQRRRLEQMGIPVIKRPDGTFVVLRVHVEHMPTQIEPQVRSA